MAIKGVALLQGLLPSLASHLLQALAMALQAQAFEFGGGARFDLVLALSVKQLGALEPQPTGRDRRRGELRAH